MRAIICWPVAASMRPLATPRITWRSVKWIRPSTDGIPLLREVGDLADHQRAGLLVVRGLRQLAQVP
jgi:hypothetical protein